LEEFWASEALEDRVQLNPKLEKISGPAPLPFDEKGNLFGAHP
jgi:hypothetical protein